MQLFYCGKNRSKKHWYIRKKLWGMLIQPIFVGNPVWCRDAQHDWEPTTPSSGNDYMTFMVPGIVAMTAVGAANCWRFHLVK